MSLPYLHCLPFSQFNVRRIPTILAKTMKESSFLGWRPLFQDTTSFSTEAKTLAKTYKSTVEVTQATLPNSTISEAIPENVSSRIQKECEPIDTSRKALIALKPAVEEAATTYPVVQNVKDWVTQGVSTLRSYFADRFSFGLWKQTPKMLSENAGNEVQQATQTAEHFYPATTSNLEKNNRPVAAASSPSLAEENVFHASEIATVKPNPQTSEAISEASLEPTAYANRESNERFTLPALFHGDIPQPLHIQKQAAPSLNPKNAQALKPPVLSQKEREQQSFWRSMFSAEELNSPNLYHDQVMDELNAQIEDVWHGRENPIADCLFEQQNAATKGFSALKARL
jgi:hypothetical protein